MADILEQIVERKRRDGLDETVPEQRGVPLLPFCSDGFTIIAEVKKASPSMGKFEPERDPVTLAGAYHAGGAGAISVLTERNYFLGAIEDLMAVKQAVPLPVLRKDFLTTAAEIEQAHRAGADAVLLIVAVLGDRVREMADAARRVGVAALTEVHDEAELDIALAAGVDLIGINNRNLKTFDVDIETCYRLKERIPDGVRVIAESGFRTPDEIRRLRDSGFAGVLIGESFVVADDPSADLRRMCEALEIS